MAGWLKRLFGGKGAPAAGSADAAPPPVARSATAVVRHRDPSAASPSTAPGFGALRPLVTAAGAIAGFEFRLATPMRAGDDPVARAAHAIALLSTMRSTIEGGRIALASLPMAVLERPAVMAKAVRGMMIAIEDGGDGEAMTQAECGAVIGRLRAQGVIIGLPASRADIGIPFDFLTLNAALGGVDALLELAQSCRLARPWARLVATGFENIDDLEQALKVGISLVSGRFDTMRSTSKKRPLQPGAQRICQLLNDLGSDQDTARIVQDIRADVPVTYRLLRYVNSPALGLSHTIDSIVQAVVLLGRNELYRWLSVMLLSSAHGRTASQALQEISLARARLLEILAREQGRDPPEALFTVGLLSVLDVMLQMPLAEALQPLRLGEAARQALLEGQGEWHDYLALAIDLERHDLDAAAGRAARFGGLPHVLECAEEAWRWAHTVQGAAQG